MTSMFRFLFRDLIGHRGSRPLHLLATSLFLGVLLISACTGLLALVRDGIASEERELFGGDVEFDVREPLEADALNWIQTRGTVSRLIEFRTMLGTNDDEFTVIELQSVDDEYPLYGSVSFEPAMSLSDATDNLGAAIDPALSFDLGLKVGDEITVGDANLTVRALIQGQPDRSFAADVSGPPVLVSQQTLDATGLITPTSRVEYEYRVRLEGPGVNPDAGVFGNTTNFLNDWRATFPANTAELNTVEDRNDRVSERLNEVAAVLLLIAVATLLVGGLGVANGVAAWMHSRRADLATLSAIGARDRWRANIMVIEILIVAAISSGVAAIIGATVAFVVSRSLSGGLPIATTPALLFWPTLVSMAFGTLAALAFAAPNLARSLSTEPAKLLRGDTEADIRSPLSFTAKILCAALALAAALALIALVPDKLIGFGFVVAMIFLYAALSGLVWMIRRVARSVVHSGKLDKRFATRRALAGMDQPGSPLRPLLLSLGIATTLLVAATIVIVAMLRMLDSTVPSRAPSLAFYDIQKPDVAAFEKTVASAPGVTDVHTVPLVLGRLTQVNGEALSSREDASEALEANDEHKLSYRAERVDNIRATSGALWGSDYQGPPLVAMEDREAGQIGVKVGDTLTFSILGQTLEAELVAIYAQGNFETRFWFEALFTPGALDDFITRYVGIAFQEAAAFDLNADNANDNIAIDILAANAISTEYPAVVTIRTSRGLQAAKRILNAAALAVSLVALTSLLASLLVLASVVAANRQRQLQEAAILHAIGSRHRSLMQALSIEYLLLGTVVAVFATVVGGVLGSLVATRWLELPVGTATWVSGAVVAVTIAGLCLTAGAIWVARSLSVSPATLLREVA
jgi:putative ABC transport system permease protein